MKKIIPILFFLSLAYTIHAQNEFYIQWAADASFSFDGNSHITDETGNLYILGTLNPGNDYVFNSVIKIDDGNNILWEKQYGNYYPGTQILFLNNALFVPFDLSIGLSVCSSTAAGSSAMESSLNAGLIINSASGDTIKTFISYDGKACGQDKIWYSFRDKNKNTITIYTNDSFTIMAGKFAPNPAFYFEKLDSDFNVVTDTLLSSLNLLLNRDTNSVSKIIYDTFTNNYVVTDMYGLRIYDTGWKLLNIINFSSFNDSFRYIGVNQIGYNADYYAFSFEVGGPNSTVYLVIINKDGQLISSRLLLSYDNNNSFFSDDLLLTNDNYLFLASSLYSDTAQKPVTFTEMDLFQNAKKQMFLGRNGVEVNKISLINSDEVIITGTAFDTSDDYPQHDMLYYYRQSLNNIPWITNDSSLCNTLTIYPNPTKNVVNISSLDFNATYNASAELFNVLGQQINSTLLDKQTLSIDLTPYPAGTYFVKTTNNKSSCITKIQKK